MLFQMQYSVARMLFQRQPSGRSQNSKYREKRFCFSPGDRELILPFQASPQILSRRSPPERNAETPFACAECAG